MRTVARLGSVGTLLTIGLLAGDGEPVRTFATIIGLTAALITILTVQTDAAREDWLEQDREDYANGRLR